MIQRLRTADLRRSSAEVRPEVSRAWKVLLVDDDSAVLQATRLALSDFDFEGRPLRLLCAASAEAARALLAQEPNIAVAIVDVVMETPEAGLELVSHIRQELNDRAMRIILRTGQPGLAPEQRIVTRYDINDYKEKIELTSTRLYTSVYAALRAYVGIRALQDSQQVLSIVAQSKELLLSQRSEPELLKSALGSLCELLTAPDRQRVPLVQAAALQPGREGWSLLVGTEGFGDLRGPSPQGWPALGWAAMIAALEASGSSLHHAGAMLACKLTLGHGEPVVLCVFNPGGAALEVGPIAGLFLGNVAAALDNLRLQLSLRHEVEVRQEAERQARVLARLPSELPEPVLRVDHCGTVVYANPPAQGLLAVLGCAVGDTLPEPWAARVLEALQTDQRHDQISSFDGRTYDVTLAPVREANYVNVFARDVTERHALLKRLEHSSFHDPLTGTANRLKFNQRLEVAVSTARRHGEQVGVMIIDLDHFKQLNDTWGHEGGDYALQVVSERLARQTRSDDLVARIGGDEFGMVIPRLESIYDLQVLAKRVLDALNEPILWHERTWSLGSAIGLATYPADASNTQDLLRCADLAMYHAKKDRDTGFRYYDEAIHKRVRRESEMEAQLRLALHDCRFELHYQPFVNLQTEQVIGAEALIRMRDCGGALVPPGEFIELAEHTGLIVPMSEWVVSSVCAQIRSWLNAGVEPPRIAVNISARYFHSRGMLDHIKGCLAANGLDAGCLELELTEGFLLGETSNAMRILDELCALGLTLAVDDFGTGYSSLSYLRRLPVSKLKIDRSFVVDILNNEDATAIVNAIIPLGHNLRLRVLAEGIETQAQRAHLLSQGCTEGQGYLFSRPIPPAAFVEYLAKTRAGGT